MPELSISSRVAHWITHQGRDREFTAADLIEAEPTLTYEQYGGVTSVLTRARRQGLVKLVRSDTEHRKGGKGNFTRFVYAVDNPNAKFRVLATPGKGGIAGAKRKNNGRATPPDPKPRPMQEALPPQDNNPFPWKELPVWKAPDVPPKVPTTLQPLHEAMLDLAVRLENVIPLCEATDEELLAEVNRRFHK